ncbi:PREDICTED: alpha-(1,3)-fucosyltransferase C-like [Rhagoletis zephyria]|uniref:alpha-(1,3)-fucosyltransferase C-like n=1 Tax=Rhagoletis zephyria TaxID=28612 RepID=UPI00081121D6|nr:PREDICTED: alpha-(1,3)-fucosyltransferase C-like [Rhagoletis zephyria]
MYSILAMSDADSESEISDYSKKPILGKIQLPNKPAASMRKHRKKRKFKGIQRRRKCICLSIVVIVSVIVVIWFIASYNVDFGIASDNDRNSSKMSPKKSILILNWHGGEVNQPLNGSCNVEAVNTTRPYITLGKYNSYDAIIMNSTAENILSGTELVTSYSQAQLIIFATQKPLQFTHNLTVLARSFFREYDKSFSYSLKSDFVWHPYKLVRLNDSKIVAPTLQPHWDAPEEKFQDVGLMRSLLRDVTNPSPLALTVLNRPCQVVRKEFVRRIMENMDVHTYGECGEYKCSNKDECSFLSNKRKDRTYKFYLAFEQELCADYVGENFYKALGGRLVPVVFGGANYEHFAPPHSYINARDFASIRELTEYLLHLDQNPEEHIKYFTWREKYKIHKSKFNLDQICDYLQSEESANDTRNKSQAARPFINWLEENKCQSYELPAAWLS